MKFLTVVLIIAAAIGAGWAYYFGPYYMDEYRMTDVVGTAALTWGAYNEDRAHVELKDQMRLREVGEYLTPEECTFYEDVGNTHVVDCSWYVDVQLPFDNGRRLNFRVAYSAAPGATKAERL